VNQKGIGRGIREDINKTTEEFMTYEGVALLYSSTLGKLPKNDRGLLRTLEYPWFTSGSPFLF
jgi:hypothetical protein